MKPTVISFFTPFYREHAETLIKSCNDLGYKYYVEPLPDQGTWEKNQSLKASFILKCWRYYKHVLWIDADAKIIRPLDIFINEIWFDFAVFRRPHKRMPFRTGTLYFGERDSTEAFLLDWADACNADINEFDQVHIVQAWRKHKDYIQTYFLPVSYCQKYNEQITNDGLGVNPDPNPHIIHYMASAHLNQSNQYMKS